MTSEIIDNRYCGPASSGNGGYVCGRLARYIPGGAEITLHAPPPLDKALDVAAVDDGRWELRDGLKLIATGRGANIELANIERASFEEAWEAARQLSVDPSEHPLPTCFVCGPARAEGDGLRIFAGPLARRSSNGSAVLAATWTPAATLASGDGFVAPEFLWSALDCPTGYASSYDPVSHSFDQTPILLGRMSARIEQRPRPGERCVITAWATGRAGRKRSAEAAAHSEAGALLATARATWITVDREVQLGCATAPQPGRVDPAPGIWQRRSRARDLLVSLVNVLHCARRAQAERTLWQYRGLIGTYDRRAGFNQCWTREAVTMPVTGEPFAATSSFRRGWPSESTVIKILLVTFFMLHVLAGTLMHTPAQTGAAPAREPAGISLYD